MNLRRFIGFRVIRITTVVCTFLIAFIFTASAQQSLLQSGPMLGYNEMREVMVWVQTNESAEVMMEYNSVNNSRIFRSNTISTTKDQAYTAHLLADQVLPGETYQYKILINGQALSFPYETKFTVQELWQFREDPPEFTFALGSCAYINEERFDRPEDPFGIYGGNYEIFEAISAKNPDLMLWLGDNVYLRDADWYSTTGIHHRYTHSRSIPEMQSLLATAHHYAIWDDHEFGPNDADRAYTLKEKTLEAFKLFWANPTYGVNGKPGVTSFFQYNDIQFFMLDNRFFRSPNKRKHTERQMLGKEQIDWLIDALCSSRSPFKFVLVGGQILNNAAVYENFATYKAERKYLLKQIKKEQIDGVVFLTGDRHHSELSKLKLGKGVDVYDLTVSPLTAGVHAADDENNKHRVSGTHVAERNFGIVRISGPRLERKMNITLYNSSGEEIWQKVID